MSYAARAIQHIHFELQQDGSSARSLSSLHIWQRVFPCVGERKGTLEVSAHTTGAVSSPRDGIDLSACPAIKFGRRLTHWILLLPVSLIGRSFKMLVADSF